MNKDNSVQYEDKKLANDFLERFFYKSFRKGEKAIEIFLIGACKANCQYCYLKKHTKDLYPLALHNYDTIITNLQKTMNWYVKNQFCCDLDIFSAEWLTTPLADRVFDVFYDTFSKVEPKYRPKTIMMADNMQFLKSDKYTEKVESYISRLKELGIAIYISASVDGKLNEYARTECDDDYYKKLNDFCLKYLFRPHPMISSDNISNWIDNYLWWRKNFDDALVKEIMTLEVRDSTWTDETIGYLLQYCDFLIDYKWKELNNNKIEMLKYIFNLHQACGEEQVTAPYNVIGLNHHGTVNNFDSLTCSNGHNLSIRMGDLTFAPCHRLFYPKLHYGSFNADENSIIDFEPTNVSLLIAFKRLKRTCSPYCEECKFNGFCPGHCPGVSFEDYGNPFVPSLEVCKLYKSKLSFLIYKYYTLNLFDEEGMEFLHKHMETKLYKYFVDLSKNILNDMNINLEVKNYE